MSHWKSVNVTYLYDGTFNGLLTIVFDCYIAHTLPTKIISEEQYEPNLLDHLNRIQTDQQKAQRIYQGIIKNISYHTLYHCYYAFLSNSREKELAIVQYLLHGFLIGPRIDTMLSVDYVFKVQALRKKALGECHRLKGLLRFMEIGEHLYYAKIHPDHNILEPLGHHFIQRLPQENFIIHDLNRNIAFLYNTKTYTIEENVTLKVPAISEQEVLFQKLWKQYFKTIAIKERKNPRCQMQYMPKKYWKDLVEI